MEYFLTFDGNIPIMKTGLPLFKMGGKDTGPPQGIEDCIRGVTFDYSYTGRREGKDRIELHVTTVVMDWQEQVFTRKVWYIGDKSLWKDCIRQHLQGHLRDLNVDSLMVKRIMRDFEVSRDNFVDWERYEPVTFGVFG